MKIMMLLLLSLGFSLLTADFTLIPSIFDSQPISQICWGDYDSDGQMDAVVVISLDNVPSVVIQHNNNGVYGLELLTLESGFVPTGIAWGDMDKDGDLDLVVAGSCPDMLSYIYYNNAGSWSPEPFYVYSGNNQKPYLFDYDNDCDLDIVILNRIDDEDYYSSVYIITIKNENGFTIENCISSINAYELQILDVNNDGYTDIFFDHGKDSASGSILYNNAGTFTLTDLNYSNGYPNEPAIMLDWYHTESPDLIFFNIFSILTYTYSEPYFEVSETLSFIGSYGSHAKDLFGCDYDNDGEEEVIYNRVLESNYIVYDTTLCVLDKTNGDMFISSLNIPGNNTCVGSIDFDSDTDLDLIMQSPDGYSHIYQNNCTQINQSPQPPANLQANLINGDLVFTWSEGSDTQTTAPSLHYNLRVGSSPGANDVFNSNSLPDGKRLIPDRGNTLQGLTHTLKNLPAGTYYWSVQTIDTQNAASTFAPEQEFILNRVSTPVSDLNSGFCAASPYVIHLSCATPGAEIRYTTDGSVPISSSTLYSDCINVNSTIDLRAIACSNNLLQSSELRAIYYFSLIEEQENLYETGFCFPQIVDIDRDQDYDIIYQNRYNLEEMCQYSNNSGEFSLSTLTGFQPYKYLLLEDMNNDNLLDQIFTVVSEDTTYSFIVYNPQGTPTPNGIIPFTGKPFPIDINNDGKKDLIMIKEEEYNKYGKVVLNEDGYFQIVTQNLNYLPIWGDLVIVDINKDGLMDFMDRSFHLFKNLGNNTFEQTLLVGNDGYTHNSQTSIADLNNDGSDDIIYAYQHEHNPGRFIKVLLSNPNSAGHFTSVSYLVDDDFWHGLNTVDMDNDGHTELVTTSNLDPSPGYTWVNDTFQEETLVDLDRNWNQDPMWFDSDNDGDLDCLLHCNYYYGYESDLIYHEDYGINNTSITNTPPSVPVLSDPTYTDGQLRFNWNTASDDHTSPLSLTYNIRIGTTSGGCDIVSPQADPATGFPYFPRRGNTLTNNFFILKDMPEGTYYYSVQALDAQFKGSLFSTEGVFEATSANDPVAPQTTLNGNFPNPFNPTTTIQYALQKDSKVRISVYNIKGQLVKDLINGTQTAGKHQIEWKGEDSSGRKCSSGVYFYRMTTDTYQKQKKALLLK